MANQPDAGAHSATEDTVIKSMFTKEASEAQREFELRRLNKALRESRLVWQAKLAQEALLANAPENKPE